MSTETPYNPYAAFENMADEDVVLKAKQEDNALAQEYLLHKYRNFVRAKARSYFLIGAEREDLIQEGMIGLYKAIRDFAAINCHLSELLLNCALLDRLLLL